MNKTTEQGKHSNNSSNSQKNKQLNKKLSKKKRKQLADKERRQNSTTKSEKISENTIDTILNTKNDNSQNAKKQEITNEIELNEEKLDNSNLTNSKEDNQSEQSSDLEEISNVNTEVNDITDIENTEETEKSKDTKDISESDQEKDPDTTEKLEEKEESTETAASSKHSKTSHSHEDNVPKHELKSDDNKKKHIFLLVLISIFIFLIILISTIFGLTNKDNPNILSGISISGIDVSGLSKEKATERVQSVLSQKLKLEITLKHNEYETSLLAENFEGNFDIEDAVNKAYEYGRSDNFFINNFKILNLKFNKVDIKCNLSYNEEQLKNFITDTSLKLPDSVTTPSYYIDNDKLIITPGKDGVEIIYDLTVNKIIDTLYNTDNSTCTIDIPVQSKTANGIDLDGLYAEIHKEASNAYYTTDPYAVFPSTTGLDFNISMEEAKQIISTPAESYEIPLKILYPEVTTNQIGNEAFPDTLGTFSTTYSASNYNRSTNIALAAEKINGIVLMPGETFSYNQSVGQRTTAAGFKSAPVYMAGQVVDGIGGGICQVSSTLYNAVLYANLDIVERHNHGFVSNYVKAGTDATVSWGSLDFKFTNSRSYPIKILSSANRGKIEISIIGLKTDNEYEVKVISNILQTIYPQTEYQYSSSLANGVTKVSSSGSNGCRCETYKVLYQNGQEVSRTLLSRDTYNPHNKIVIVGTNE